MQDTIIKGTGNSRSLKSVPNFLTLYPSYEAFAQALVAGTLPIDLGALNPTGVAVQGTDLSAANLLTDETAALYGKDAAAVPDDIFKEIKNGISDAELQAFMGSASNRVVETLTASGTWRAPSNMVGNIVLAVLLGGAGGNGGSGGRGGGGTYGGYGGGGGSGGSGHIKFLFLKIEKNVLYPYTIGAKGNDGSSGSDGGAGNNGDAGGSGEAGGITSFPTLEIFANGGQGGTGGAGGTPGSSSSPAGYGGSGGNGGSGGYGGNGGNGGNCGKSVNSGVSGGRGGNGGSGGTYGGGGAGGNGGRGSDNTNGSIGGSGGHGGAGGTYGGGGKGGSGGRGSSSYSGRGTGGRGGNGGSGGTYGGGGKGGNGGEGSISGTSGADGTGGSGSTDGKPFLGPVLFSPATPLSLSDYSSSGGSGGGGYGAKGTADYGGGFGPIEQLLGLPNFGKAGKIVLIYPVEVQV